MVIRNKPIRLGAPLSARQMETDARSTRGMRKSRVSSGLVNPDGVHSRRVFPARATGFWAIITGSAADGTNRWKYAWTEQSKTVAGYDGWANKTSGRSGTTSVDPARNTIEDMNDASGVQGNGVDVANLDTADYTFAIQAAPAGVVVWMYIVEIPALGEVDASTEYWFSYVNGVDGGCD